MRERTLPFALPDLDEREIEAVSQVLRSGWVTMGPKVFEFERSFADFVGARFAVAVNSCTAALHLALESAGVGRGDFVITSPYTFGATAEVVRYFEATPVFVDVEPETLNLDPGALAETIGELTDCLGRVPRSRGLNRALAGRRREDSEAVLPGRLKAVIPVHFAGHPCDMDPIREICGRYGLALIEDAAHAFPASYRGRTVGATTSDDGPHAACFSFYATKTITTGEGGMITTDSEEWAARFARMRLHGIDDSAWERYSVEGSWRYEILAPGYKYNMTDVAAAMGLVQLDKAKELWRKRCEIARRYQEAFADEPALRVPSCRDHVEHAWHLYPLRLNPERLAIGRSEFLVELKKRRVAGSVHFIPLHTHPYYRDTYGYRPEDFPVAFEEFQREVSLPIYSGMTEADVEDVIEAVLGIVAKNRRRGMHAAV